MDWLESQVDSVPDGERIVCMGHNPYTNDVVHGNFCADELHQISDRGLLNNKPIATSIGGHVEYESYGRLPYDSDTICDFFTMGAAHEGYVYVFHVKDDVKLQLSHTHGPFPGRNVQFQGTYSYQGSENASVENRWDYGDGSGLVYGPLQVSHEYDNVDRDTTYKVSLRVTTQSGRHVWVCDTVRILHEGVHDVSCTAVNAPPDTIHLGTDVPPSVCVSNNGLYAESYTVRLKIVNEADSVVYDTMASVSGQQPEHTDSVTFPTWHADVAGRYIVACSTELASDSVPSNDKLTDTCMVVYPYDVSADDITSPSRVGYYEWLMPLGQVTNHYDDSVTFWVKFVIEGVYADSHQVTMPGLSSQVEGFDSIREIEPGTYDMELVIRLTGDERPANDTFSAQLLVVDSDYWVKLTALPLNHHLVLVEGPDEENSVYAVQRDGSGLARYSVPLDLWNVDIIPPNSALDAHCSADRYGGFIYVLGTYGPRTAIARYAIDANQWDTLTTNLPSGAVENGGIFARHADTLYVLLRNAVQSFWRYVVPTRSWTWLQLDPPLGSYGTAASTYDGVDLIHVLQVTPEMHGVLQTYDIGTGQWQQSPALENDLLPGAGIAITTVPGRNSVFALWPSDAFIPLTSPNFDEFDLSGGMWMPLWPYFDSVGPHPSMTSRDGLPYATCGIPQATINTFGRYYPVLLALGREGVCADAVEPASEYGLNSVPNPFTRGTTIRWQVPKTTRALVAVYDAQGRLVKRLHDGNLGPGRYSQVWNTQRMPAGVYLCSFTSSERRLTQRLILVK